MKRTVRICVLGVCALAAAIGVAKADIAPQWSDDQLASFADAIVTGRVTDVSTGRDGTGAIYTYVAISVDTVLKGDIAEREIVVKQLGGVIGGEGLGVGDQATFGRGEEVLLFLETRPRDRTLYTAALWQGKWTIDRDATTGERIAVRKVPNGHMRGALRGDPERRTLSTFINRMRSAGLTRDNGAVRGFVAMPPAEELQAAVRDSMTAGAPYVLFSPAWRWNQIDTGASIPVDIMSSGQPGLSGGGGNELIRAVSIWSGPTGLRFVAGGSTSRCSEASGPLDRITIVYSDPCGEISNGGGTLAIGGAYYSTGGGVTRNGVNFNRAVSGFIVNNDSATAASFLSNSGCFASVETHELGHVLGLDHSADQSAIMFASVSFSSCSRGPVSISADDIAGIRLIYGTNTPTPSSAPGAPTGLTTSASGSTVFISWAAPTSGGAPTAYIIEAGSSSGASNLAVVNTGSTATTFSAGGVGAGSYFIRVKATNAAGTSPASNESLLAVGPGGGPCTGPPGAPTGFTLTGNSGGTVAFSWNASSGSPTTYIIEAGSTPGASNLANSDLGGTATSFTAAGVGRGTYYVRLRAQNTCGTSGPSNEVTLVVP
jgi:hypothetical protein